MSLVALALGVTGSVVAAVPSPSPTPVEASLELTATPGLAGFLVVFAIAIASIGLFLSLTRHLRVVDRRARQRDELDAAGGSGDDGPGDVGPGTGGSGDDIPPAGVDR